MGFVILRTAKISKLGSITASLDHTFRERPTPNADGSRTSQNTVLTGAVDRQGVMAGIEARMPAKARKDAVRAIEYFIGHSPESEPGDGYFKDALKWLQERHGVQNVISAVVHRDEKTPHLVAYVVPLDGDKLNAKKWLGGREKLRQMQTEFADQVGRRYMLARGIEGSRAKHTTVKEFYAALDQAEAMRLTSDQVQPQVLKKGFLRVETETPGMVADRLNSSMAPIRAAAATAQIDRKRVKEAQQTAKNMRDQVQPIIEAAAPLNAENRLLLVNFTVETGRRLLERQRQKEKERDAKIKEQLDRATKEADAKKAKQQEEIRQAHEARRIANMTPAEFQREMTRPREQPRTPAPEQQKRERDNGLEL